MINNDNLLHWKVELISLLEYTYTLKSHIVDFDALVGPDSKFQKPEYLRSVL
jgi:hypothetical protein